MSIEAMKQVLEALEIAEKHMAYVEFTEAITSLHQAIAEAEKQEPVAWLNPYGGVLQRLDTGLEKSTYTIPLYTHPQPAQPKREWVGLTVDEINQAIEDNKRFGGFRTVGFAYDIETILKEKNT